MITGSTDGRDGASDRASDNWGNPPTNWGVAQRLGCGTERVWDEVGKVGRMGNARATLR